MTVGGRILRAKIDATDFGGQHETVARLGAQHASEAQLALAIAIPGRRVEIAYAPGMGGFERRLGLLLGIDLAGIAKAGAAHTKLRDFKLRAPDTALEKRVHPHGLS